MPGEVLAVAVNFVHTIADGQQLSFGTAFAIDMSRAEKVRILDELADLSARQAARARRPSVLRDLAKHKTTVAQYIEDMERLQANWPLDRQRLVDAIAAAEDEAAQQLKIDDLKAQIAGDLQKLRERRATEYNTGVAEWRAMGKVGDYKPRGHRATNLERMDAGIKLAVETASKMLEQLEYERLVAIDAAKDALTKAEAERTAAVGHLDASVKRWRQEIEVREEELAEIETLLKD